MYSNRPYLYFITSRNKSDFGNGRAQCEANVSHHFSFGLRSPLGQTDKFEPDFVTQKKLCLLGPYHRELLLLKRMMIRPDTNHLDSPKTFLCGKPENQGTCKTQDDSMGSALT